MYKAGDDKFRRDLAHGGFFLFLNILDYLTTHLLITTGGMEIMPLGASVIESHGLAGLFTYKMGLTALVLIATLKFKFSETFWNLLNGVFTGIVTWNSMGSFLSIFFD